MTPDQRRIRLRDILGGPTCITASSLFDPMSARIADDLGFEVGLIGGSVASLAVLGAPDQTLITLSELAEQARRVCRAGNISVLVDADHGYGNALNVARTIEEMLAAGVAGVTIEDTLLPAAFGQSGKVQLISIEEGIGKMKAAVRVRAASPFVVLGRTSAPSITGVDDAIRRLQAYERAGVDALFVPGLQSREQLDAIAGAVKLPIVLAACDESLADPSYLASRGVRIWMAGHQPFAAAVQAMYDSMKAVRDGALPSGLRGVAAPALMARLIQAAHYDALGTDYGLR
jgi:carboxyvinyl-carboxyphosphonate phosphorylmutase